MNGALRSTEAAHAPSPSSRRSRCTSGRCALLAVASTSTSTTINTSISTSITLSLRSRTTATVQPAAHHALWQLFALTQYDALIFLDADVEVMPLAEQPSLWQPLPHRHHTVTTPLPYRYHNVTTTSPHHHHTVTTPLQVMPLAEQPPLWVGRKWARAIVRLLGSPSTQLQAGWDPRSPFNAGLMLLRPNRSLFDDGLNVLERCRYNTSHGWDESGPLHPVDRYIPLHRVASV